MSKLRRASLELTFSRKIHSMPSKLSFILKGIWLMGTAFVQNQSQTLVLYGPLETAIPMGSYRLAKRSGEILAGGVRGLSTETKTEKPHPKRCGFLMLTLRQRYIFRIQLPRSIRHLLCCIPAAAANRLCRDLQPDLRGFWWQRYSQP